tara:strand:+ start:486 stop:812 length:327 start_codon:yes stop_codon:yes gene_type:complete
MSNWHPNALTHGRVLFFDCKNKKTCPGLEESKKSDVNKNNVLNKNGSNESAAMRWAKGISNNYKSAGRANYEGCKVFSLFPKKTTYNCAEIMLQGETLDRTQTKSCRS